MRRLLACLLAMVLVFGGFAQAETWEDAVEASEANAAAENDEIVYDPDEELALDDITEAYAGAAESLKKIDGMLNVLLIGMDTRPNEQIGRSDTMILLTLDAEHGMIKMTSFLRDLYVEIPGHGKNRLNAAIVFGGPDLLIQTLNRNFGVQVDYYVGVNFSLLADVIDQMGGLTLRVEQRYVPRINAVIKMDNKVLKIDIEDGLLEIPDDQFVDGVCDWNLTGKQAEAWARFRYGVPGDGDLDRSDRQRTLILTAVSKLSSQSMFDLLQLAMTNMGRVTTNMSLLTLTELAPAVFQLSSGTVRELRIPIKGSYRDAKVSGMAVYVADRAKNLNAFTEFILAE